MSMGIWKWIQRGSGLIAGLLLAVIWFFAEEESLARAASAVAAGMLLLSLYAGRMRRNTWERMQSEAEKRSMIATVNQYRHDWMNDIQVLYGYVQLNKQDKLKSYIEQVSDKLHRESLITKLGIPSLTAYLFSYRCANKSIELIVRPECEIVLSELGECGSASADAIIEIIEAYQAAADTTGGETGRLIITLDRMEQDVLIAFEYNGLYREAELRPIMHGLIEKWRGYADIQAAFDYQDETADVELRLRVTDN